VKLIMENWRGYQEDLIVEGKVVDAIKAGFSKLIKIPDQFDQMVEKTKQNFQKLITKNIKEWSQGPEMKKAGDHIAAAIKDHYGDNLQEALTAKDGTQKTFTVDELREMGVGPETIELITTSATGMVANTLINAVEEVIGKPAPPKLKDWLLRFVSKFIGSFVFGFIDNFIMVIAGTQIDVLIGGLVGAGGGAMLAAGLGNTLSDAIGEIASNSIESVMQKAGLDPQAVSDEEVAAGPMWMRFLDSQAGVIGIILGCLVGLFPLLFLEEKEK